MGFTGDFAFAGRGRAQLPLSLDRAQPLASIVATLRRVLIGFGLAAVIGRAAGDCRRILARAGRSHAPVALFGRNIPVAALIPLTILWFGIDETQKVMFIFIACVPFVFSDAVRR